MTAAALTMTADFHERGKELWIFGQRISEGMSAEIKTAEQMKIVIRYFDTNMEESNGQYI